MSRRRLELLQWWGLVAAPAAWMGQYVAGVFLAQGRCEATHWSSGWAPAQVAITAAAAVVAVLGEAAALAVYRELRGVDHDAAGPAGRQQFFAIGGLIGNVLFLVAIVLTGAVVVGIQACRQS
jgi:hypothetical protein